MIGPAIFASAWMVTMGILTSLMVAKVLMYLFLLADRFYIYVLMYLFLLAGLYICSIEIN